MSPNMDVSSSPCGGQNEVPRSEIHLKTALGSFWEYSVAEKPIPCDGSHAPAALWGHLGLTSWALPGDLQRDLEPRPGGAGRG